MDFLNSIKDLIPDYAKDIRLNVDGTIARSSLAPEQALGVALAAAFAAKSKTMVDIIKNSGALPEVEVQAALTAAALMGMNNAWYPFTEMTEDKELQASPAQLRMNAYASSGGTSKVNFELYALAASVIGKCHFCIKSHYDLLKQHGMTMQQLKDAGRIAATLNAAAQVLAAEGK
ncbi:MAG: carboxymuconolactone decarboxylase family protein [Burkholderiales bacterium]|jgi:alkyl hydroperoxide reductase subunit D|nr:carboxymuconolactone decarboxylase family protein [Burkholderiales bacterium]MCA3154534.1 carboxymuconolactone decarboxylase family protein [Burkholderiales bacterium]MCA3155935.1 carboxymuconolactone decarboxylase family protein [Burkholderiales bacterium]MCA3175109.1 carboxymuconolactone decarboxylase family protein [Burkholderiales bacterium]MCE2984201.1 carboxymuconolactone decarboxylase family protein [Burkholderiales bacterium]